MHLKSIIEDKTLLNARVHNYRTLIQEEVNNKHKVEELIKRLKDGEVFNLVLQGNPGAGKSHLAYAVLHELNETRVHTCLFISVEAMLRKIKQSFNDKGSEYTEAYFTDLLSSVDFLVLDDLGAETGAINTDKEATNFVQKVLYGIATSRQSKATIITTNLNSATLYNMYDRKLVSRLLKSPEVVVFKETTDKRMTTLF
jgi:DNA replication protein DnaC